MKAVDTNILARFLLEDDPAQSPIARNFVSGGAFISNSVLLEVVWLLESRYGLNTRNIATALQATLASPGVHVANPDLISWALGRYAAGADFADMVHLIESGQQDAFVTFDRKLAKQAGKLSPIRVELLES